MLIRFSNDMVINTDNLLYLSKIKGTENRVSMKFLGSGELIWDHDTDEAAEKTRKYYADALTNTGET